MSAYKKYYPMLKGILEPAEAKELITSLKIAFTREDRIVWSLRIIKCNLLQKKQSHTRKEKAFLNRFKAHIDEELTPLEIRAFEHFLSQNLSCIDKIVFSKQSVKSLLNELTAVEEKYLSRLGESRRLVDEEGIVICEVDEKYSWFDLQTYYSESERKACGHCGNSWGNRNQTIFSLRAKSNKSKDGTFKWTPHATFVFNKNTKSMGERKGRFNLKPNENLHGAIVTLLSSCLDIESLDASSSFYNQQRDFEISDLSEKHLRELKRNRPDLTKWEAHPESIEYAEASQAWVNHANNIGSTQLSKSVLSASKKCGLQITSIPFDSPENCSPSQLMAIHQVSPIVFTKLMKETQENGELFSQTRKTESVIAKLFIECFMENPRFEAIPFFCDLIKASMKGATKDNELYELNRFYPEVIKQIPTLIAMKEAA